MALQFENNSFGPGNKPKPKKISGGQKKLDNPLANALMGGTPAANPMGGTEMDFDMPDMGAMQMNAPSSMGDGYGNMMEKMLWTNELDQNTGKWVYGPPTGKFDLDPYEDPSGSTAGGGIDDSVGMRAQPTGMAGFAGAAPAGRSGYLPGDMAGPGGQPDSGPYEPIDWPTDGDGRKMVLDNGNQRRPHNWYGQNPPELYPRPDGGGGGTLPPWSGDPVINNMGGAQSPQGFGWDDPMMGGMPMDTPMMNDPMMGQPDMNDPMMNDPMMGGMEMGQPDMGQPFMGDPMMGMQGQPQQGLGQQQPAPGQQPGQNQIASDYQRKQEEMNQYQANVSSPMTEKMWDQTNEGWDITKEIADEINTGNPYGDRLAGRSSFAGGQPSSGGDALSNALRGPQADFPEAQVAGPETASLPTVSQLDQEVAPSVSEAPIVEPAVEPAVAPTVSLPPTGNDGWDPTGDTPEPEIAGAKLYVPPSEGPAGALWGGGAMPEVSPEKRALIKQLEDEGAFTDGQGNVIPYHDDVGQHMEVLDKAMKSRPIYGLDKPAEKKPEQVTVDGKQYKKESDRKEGEYGTFASEYPKGSGNWNLMSIDPPAPREDEPAEDKPALEEFKDKVDAGEVSDEPNKQWEELSQYDKDSYNKMYGEAELKDYIEKYGLPPRTGGRPNADGTFDLPQPQRDPVRLTAEEAEASAVWNKFNADMAYGDGEGVLKELGIDKDYMLKMQQVGGRIHQSADPRRRSKQPPVTMFKGPDGRRFQRKVTNIGTQHGWTPRGTWTEVKMDAAQQRAENQRDSDPGIPRPGDDNSKRVTANNGEEGWKLSDRGQPGIGNYGDFVDEDGEIVSFEKPERDPNILRRFDAGRSQLPQGPIGTASSESRSVAQEADPADKFSEVGDAAYGEEAFNPDDWLVERRQNGDYINEKTDEKITADEWRTRMRAAADREIESGPPIDPLTSKAHDLDDPREDEGDDQAPEADAGSASPEDLNNPDNWDTSGGQYTYRGAEFGASNANPPADTEDWARTRAAAASKTSGAAAAPEVYLPPDTFGVGDGGGPSDQERKKADKMERDDYDLSPGVDNVPLDLMQDEYGDIDSYNARMLEVTPGSTTREELAERDVTFPQQQQLVNKEWGEQWGDAFQQALSPTGRQRVSRPGMTSGSGNEMQTMAAANAMLGGRMAEQLIPHKYALQHSKKVKDLLAFANQEGIDMANLLQSDWYSGANDLAREEAINQVIQNAAANNRATSWR